MFGVRKAPTGCNFVHNDEIWKDHVQRELQTSRKWPDTWGFLAVHYNKANAPAENDGLASRKPPSQIANTASPTLTCKLPPIPQTACSQDSSSSSVREVDKALPPRMSYPKTTAGEVGRLCADFKRLEKFGRHARGQNGIRKLLNWPREAIY